MPAVDFSKFGEIEVKALSRIKKLSGANLHRNWVAAPHVTQFDEVDITDLEAFRKGMQDEAAKQGVKLTLLPFLMKAVVAGLKTYPEFNASLRDRRRKPGAEKILPHRLCGRHPGWPGGAGDSRCGPERHARYCPGTGCIVGQGA